MSKKQHDIQINFVGENATDVTGSCIHIKTPNYQILLECGLYQSNRLIEDYNVNSKKFKFKPQHIDFVFAVHPHIDHIGNIPRLFKEGFKGKVISSYETAQIARPLLLNSQFILESDAIRIGRKRNREIPSLYEKSHIYQAYENWYMYNTNDLVVLNDEISFRFLNNSHTLGAKQLLLYIKNNLGITKTILYTSDLGGIKLKQYYTDDMEYAEKANIIIGECTYGAKSKSVTEKDRAKDLEKLKSVIIQTCCDSNNTVLIPSFSFGRSQYIVSLIYELFKDEMWQPNVYMDSLLTSQINKVYSEVLQGEDKDKWQEVLCWGRLKIISDNYEESKLLQSDKTAKVVISSSGMLTGGRSVQHLKSIISDTKNMIVFVGYSSPTSLAGKVKSSIKNIKIEQKVYKNNCNCINLKSFSSHMQRDEMLKYYSDINCEKIYLVHGEITGKLEFKQDLEKELSKKLKTTKVISTNKGTTCNL